MEEEPDRPLAPLLGRHRLSHASHLAQLLERLRTARAALDPHRQNVEEHPVQLSHEHESVELRHRRPADPLGVVALPVLVGLRPVARDDEASASLGKPGVRHGYPVLYHLAGGDAGENIHGGASRDLAVSHVPLRRQLGV